MPARAFKHIKSFLLEKFKAKSRKGKERDSKKGKRPSLGLPPEWPATLLVNQTQRPLKTDKPLPALPSAVIAAIRRSFGFEKSLPEIPARGLSLVGQLPALKPAESYTTVSSTATGTTTLATTLDPGI
jgi:hypothetical protein